MHATESYGTSETALHSPGCMSSQTTDAVVRAAVSGEEQAVQQRGRKATTGDPLKLQHADSSCNGIASDVASAFDYQKGVQVVLPLCLGERGVSRQPAPIVCSMHSAPGIHLCLASGNLHRRNNAGPGRPARQRAREPRLGSSPALQGLLGRFAAINIPGA